MTGLKRQQDASRTREAFDLLVIGGVERLTESLRRGEPFSDRALRDMQKLQARLSAFSDALDARVSMELIDD